MVDKKKVLIVDDVAENLHLLTSMLKHKYAVSAATNGEKALELAFKEPRPDIIFLDVYMPNMNGFEVCKRLKNDDTTKDIPVVFVSSAVDIKELADNNGCYDVDFINKPVTRDTISDKIESRLSKTDKNIDELEPKDYGMDEKATILVVDDTPETIKVIVEILKEHYKVSVATSGQKALDMLDDGLDADLILLDIIMPEMDGYEVCETLQKNPLYKDIPVMFLTVLENDQDIVKGFELGAVDYVTKPVEPTVLKARVQTHLKLKKFRAQLLKNLREKEELLIKQSKMAIMGEMFENVTHQWKQPLSVITLATDTINMTYDLGELDEPKLKANLGSIKNSTRHLASTIDDFRDFLKEDIQKQYFNVKDSVEKTLKLLNAKFINKEISIDDSELKDIELYGLKNDLTHILMNLFNNAKDALANTPSNRAIKVVSDKIGENLVLKIKDNGGGIGDDIKDMIFEKYFTTKDKDKGTGIGLYMTKTLIEDHLGGSIKAYNEDGGACFELTIPLK